MAQPKLITACLWFTNEAEEAAELYVSLFPDSSITNVTRRPEGVPGGEAGAAFTVEFELAGTSFTALNGGEAGFTFDESISFQIDCADQAEVDHYWDGLLTGGGTPSQCGWLKDKFGISWQVIPRALPELLADPDPAVVDRVMTAMLQMVKLEVEPLYRAAKGE